MGRDQNASGYKGTDGSDHRHTSISERVPTWVVSKTEPTKRNLGDNFFPDPQKFSPEKPLAGHFLGTIRHQGRKFNQIEYHKSINLVPQHEREFKQIPLGASVKFDGTKTKIVLPE
jgi:hypothetical protein